MPDGALSKDRLPDERLPNERISDEQIIERVVAGDVDLFEILVDRHRDLIFELLSRRLPATEVPAVAQDVFISAWTSLPRFTPRAPFERWLTRLALRRCHDHWRTRYSARQQPDEPALAELGDPTAPRTANRREDAEVLQLLLARLPPDDRAVLTLLHLDERPVAEVAEILEWSADKVKTRAHRARRHLRDLAAHAAAAGRPYR